MSAPAAPDETAGNRTGTVERAPAAERNPQRPGAHPRRGRRPGNPGTRLAILRSAIVVQRWAPLLQRIIDGEIG